MILKTTGFFALVFSLLSPSWAQKVPETAQLNALSGAFDGQKVEQPVSAKIKNIYKSAEEKEWKKGGRWQFGGFLGQSLEDIKGEGSGAAMGVKLNIPVRNGFGIEAMIGKISAGYQTQMIGQGEFYPDEYSVMVPSTRYMDKGGDRYVGALMTGWKFHPSHYWLKNLSLKSGIAFGTERNGEKVYDKAIGYLCCTPTGGYRKAERQFPVLNFQTKNWGLFPAAGASYNIPFYPNGEKAGPDLWKVAVEPGWLHIFNGAKSRNYLTVSVVVQRHKQ